jgi:hypothetical protein
MYYPKIQKKYKSTRFSTFFPFTAAWSEPKWSCTSIAKI